MMPLWTTAMLPRQSSVRVGVLAPWARPWVAQRVWPMPMVPPSGDCFDGLVEARAGAPRAVSRAVRRRSESRCRRNRSRDIRAVRGPPRGRGRRTCHRCNPRCRTSAALPRERYHARRASAEGAERSATTRRLGAVLARGPPRAPHLRPTRLRHLPRAAEGEQRRPRHVLGDRAAGRQTYAPGRRP